MDYTDELGRITRQLKDVAEDIKAHAYRIDAVREGRNKIRLNANEVVLLRDFLNTVEIPERPDPSVACVIIESIETGIGAAMKATNCATEEVKDISDYECW